MNLIDQAIRTRAVEAAGVSGLQNEEKKAVEILWRSVFLASLTGTATNPLGSADDLVQKALLIAEAAVLRLCSPVGRTLSERKP